MSSSGFCEPIEIQSSRAVVCGLLLIQLSAAIYAVTLVRLPLTGQLALCSIAMGIAVLSARRHLGTADRCHLVIRGDGSWCMHSGAGPSRPVELLRNRSFWCPWLVGLTIRAPPRRALCLWITRKSLSSACWRRLQVRLHHA
jgi:hypothetical protein